MESQAKIKDQFYRRQIKSTYLALIQLLKAYAKFTLARVKKSIRDSIVMDIE